MTITEQEAEFEQGMEELYKEFKKQYKDEYVFEQVHNYYHENPDIAREPLEFLSNAKLILSHNYTSAFILATISIEVGIKVIILKPVLFSLAFDKTAGELLFDLTFKRISVPNIPALYFKILKDYTGFDFNNYVRSNGGPKFRNELKDLQDLRNRIIHQAKTASEHDANQAIHIAESIYEELIPKMLDSFQFHIKNEKISYGSRKQVEFLGRFNANDKSK